MLKVLSLGHQETVDAGLRLGRLLRAGDTVCLQGDLGSGKTTFVKGLAGAMGIVERDVSSASFTIIAEYDSDPPFYHIDLYRLDSRAEMEDAGIYECLGGRGIAAIEWAERVAPEAVEDAIKVEINFLSEDKREITIKGISEADWNRAEKGG